MLDDRITERLGQSPGPLPAEVQARHRAALLAAGCSEAKNSSFIEFVAVFSDEHQGRFGSLADLGPDLCALEEGKDSVAGLLWSEGVPRRFLPLTSLETEAYFLYDTDDDSVVLVEDGSLPRLLAGDVDQRWPSFDAFLAGFFDLE